MNALPAPPDDLRRKIATVVENPFLSAEQIADNILAMVRGAALPAPEPPRLWHCEKCNHDFTGGPIHQCNDGFIANAVRVDAARTSATVASGATALAGAALPAEHAPPDSIENLAALLAQGEADAVAGRSHEAWAAWLIARGVSVGAPPLALTEPAPPSGTMQCPVCGIATPHNHDVDAVNRARVRLARDIGLEGIALEIVRTARPTHNNAVFLSGDLIRRLEQALQDEPVLRLPSGSRPALAANHFAAQGLPAKHPDREDADT